MEEHLANIPTSEQLTETIQRATQQAMKAVLQEATLHEPPSEQHAEQPSAPPSQQAASGPTLIAPPPPRTFRAPLQFLVARLDACGRYLRVRNQVSFEAPFPYIRRDAMSKVYGMNSY